ncbi:MAG: RimK family alpha-L-glutamate ligase [Candidatus Nanoarchaeia archaeon]
MKLAIISLGGTTSKNILEEAKKYFDVTEGIDIRHVDVRMGSDDWKVFYKGKEVENYDCVYIRGSYKYALLQSSITSALYNKSYMPLHSNSFTLGHDKLLTLIELQKLKIPLPTTYVSATSNAAKELFNTIRYPIIIKIPCGTQGKGVMVADSVQAARSVIDALDVFNQPYIIQEFLETDASDIRAIVCGDKVVACMKRKNPSSAEFRANIHQGGVGEPFLLDFDGEQVAVRAAKALKCDICAVDMLEYNGKMHVIEVNLSPGLEGINEALNSNVAVPIAKYLYERTKEFVDGKRNGDFNHVVKNIAPQELISNLNIRGGMIRLPELVTKLTGFTPDDDVRIVASKGTLKIDKYKIGEN